MDNNDHKSVDMAEMSLHAVKYAQEFNVTLDYSDASIEDVEKLMDHFYKDVGWEERNEEASKRVWILSFIWGSYIGETLLRNHLKDHWAWQNLEDTPILKRLDKEGWVMSPLAKVQKRLIRGKEDNIKSFYDIAIAITQGKLKFPPKDDN